MDLFNYNNTTTPVIEESKNLYLNGMAELKKILDYFGVLVFRNNLSLEEKDALTQFADFKQIIL